MAVPSHVVQLDVKKWCLLLVLKLTKQAVIKENKEIKAKKNIKKMSV